MPEVMEEARFFRRSMRKGPSGRRRSAIRGLMAAWMACKQPTVPKTEREECAQVAACTIVESYMRESRRRLLYRRWRCAATNIIAQPAC